ncbi:MAG: DUF4265 domain-containing protein [Pseudohongiella sp.]|nr:DUF4265 domain-containing protein [Pseudohongiella sp.]MDO9521030.1 DUF4265 domain-containing protein [Pseudohongiella sp.]MDP2128964.1 DUF4265 domain-containing protein [Pseudohongiella sp.]
MTDDATNTVQLPLIAGYNPQGEAIVEQINASVIEGNRNEFRVQTSPAFVRGLAADDKIRYPIDDQAGWELVEHSGNLCIRVFSKHNTEELDQMLTPEIELIDGKLDLKSPRILIYTIHVSIGFQKIEDVLNKVLAGFPDTVWYYGNVYDPEDGVTPLNWWQEIAGSV